MHIRFIALTLLIITAAVPARSAEDPAEKYFKLLRKTFTSGTGENFEKEGNLFLKKFPGSSRVPDVRLMLAEKESDIDTAIDKYRFVIRNYSGYRKRDYALYKICQILDLKSKWKELRTESLQGIKLFSSGEYSNEFRLLHITSLIMLGDYAGAKNECMKLTDHTHDFGTLAKAMYLMAETEQKTGGNSRAYIYDLRELAVGFKNSEIYPSVIFRLAQFYEEKKDYDRAYSAYSDITEVFPDSPEALMAIHKIGGLKKLNPKKMHYMPDKALVNGTEELAISPEYEIQKEKNEIYYAVAIGPYTRLKDSSGITKYLKNYENVRRIKTPYGYMVYIGKYDDTESALEIRIRLAEEYGINGNIVRFSEHDKKSYIYEDR